MSIFAIHLLGDLWSKPFVGILIEHFAGKFPLWLSPEQIRVLPITDDHLAYAQQITKQLVAAGLRCTVDEKPEKLGAKIRDARNARASYFAVVGGQEVTDGTVALQTQAGVKVGTLTIDALISKLQAEITAMTLPAAETPTT